METIIARIKRLPPHDIRETVCLNSARMIVTNLAKPLAEILQAIEQTKTEGQKAQKRRNSTQHKDLKSYTVVTKTNKHPKTVCHHSSCNTVDKGIVKGRVCHPKCYDIDTGLNKDYGHILGCGVFIDTE